MADKLSLEILIKTIADAKGIQTTDAEIKTLAKDMESAAAAGKPLETNAEQIAQKLQAIGAASTEASQKADGLGKALNTLSNDELLALEEKLRSDIKAQQDLGKNTDELKAKLKDVFSTRTERQDIFEALKRSAPGAASSVDSVTKQLGSLKTASAGAQQTVAGLAQGGLGGLVQAGRGVITVFTALSHSAIGAILLPALAAAGAAFGLMSSIVESNRKTIEKWGKESAERAEKMKSALAEIDNAAAKSLQDQLDKVGALDKSYAKLTEEIDKARQRTDALNKAETERRLAEIDAREAEALEKAPTDQAKAAVQKKFASDRQLVRDQSTDTDITNKKLGAQVDRVAAEEQLKAAQEAIDTARAAADAARQAFENAKSNYVEFVKDGGDRTSKFGQELSDAATAARRAMENAQKNFEAVDAAQTPRRDAAQDKLNEAKLTEQLAEIERQKFEAEKRSAAAAKRAADAKEKEARISEEIAAGISRQQAEARERPNLGGSASANGKTAIVAPSLPKTAAEKQADEAINQSQKPAPFSPGDVSVTPVAGRERASARQTRTESDNFSGATEAAQQDINNAATQIAAVQPAPALDLSPIADAFSQYNQANAQKHLESEQSIGNLAKRVTELANQLQAVSESTQS